MDRIFQARIHHMFGVRVENHLSKDERSDIELMDRYLKKYDPFYQTAKLPSQPKKYPAVPARLDADRTAKPLNKIKVHLDPTHCFYGVLAVHDPVLQTNMGDIIHLYR